MTKFDALLDEALRLLAAGHRQGARAISDRALAAAADEERAAATRLFAAEHSGYAARDAPAALRSLAEIALAAGRPEDASRRLHDALYRLERITVFEELEDIPVPGARIEQARCYASLGDTLVAQKLFDQARDAYRRALTLYRGHAPGVSVAELQKKLALLDVSGAG